MQKNKPVLIVAQSGRALAVSAAKAGITAYVVDQFGDQDTCESAKEVLTAKGTGSGFDTENLKTLLQQYMDVPLAGVVVGSGLESEPEILDWISQHWHLSGNSAGTVKFCKEPTRFFPLLDSLDILHPEVRYDFTADDKQWLIKQTGGSGGGHISVADDCIELPDNYYLQEKISGRNYSVVFLADGKSTTVIGWSETWNVDQEHGNYVYTGAISYLQPDKNLLAVINDIIVRLVPALGLKGLCGMDFIVDEDNKCYVLEVNPRPTATFELHENKESLLQAHIMACNGELIPDYKKLSIFKAHRIIYAENNLAIPAINWPEWVTDRSVAGKTISAGTPVCTVHADGVEKNTTITLLETRTKSLQELIKQYCLAA